jgi:hypothetical protein
MLRDANRGFLVGVFWGCASLSEIGRLKIGLVARAVTESLLPEATLPCRPVEEALVERGASGVVSG